MNFIVFREVIGFNNQVRTRRSPPFLNLIDNVKSPGIKIKRFETEEAQKFGKKDHKWDDITILGIEVH